MAHQFIYDWLTLFVIIDPIGVAAVFLGLTTQIAAPHRRHIAIAGILIATLIMLVFAFAGKLLLAILGISLAAFQIAGGLLLFFLATDMVLALHSGIRSTTAPEQQEAEHSHDITVFPLAIPLLAGPGALTSITLLMGNAPSLTAQAIVIGALAAVMAVGLVMLVAAASVARLLGVTGANVVTRVLGVMLAALATQYVIDGIRTSFSPG